MCSWAALLCALLGAWVPSIRLSAVSGLALRSAPFLGRCRAPGPLGRAGAPGRSVVCGVRLRVPTALLGAPNACLRAWLLGAVLLGRASRAPGRFPGEKPSSSGTLARSWR
ncbi:hypothetical protein J4T94_gp059 [Mycobacterium phage Krypton555]|uniref:Uncharacterized protein n=1 Tax=Mycobacterium phage Krypton555 TaxID=2015885 RepID=A0A222ZR36_9CAUD|nr:hypothetical protein J4T94_gp059 [Mycobacterium phage Krypton555]ASR87157.1 hypothetical protein KRYPTON555_133 [Mycobacterium phage Krypton555]